MSSMKELRVIFVGNSQVGKTTLMNRYIDGEFTEQSQTTINPIFNPATAVSRNGNEITMQLWDTAGQEKYQSLSQVFYRDSHVAVICFDVQCEESCEAISEWKRRIIEHEPKCALIVVGTKIDLYPPEQRAKVIEITQKAASDIGIASSFVTSSVTGEGIKELFSEIATLGEEILKNQEKPAQANVVSVSQNTEKKPKKDCNC